MQTKLTIVAIAAFCLQQAVPARAQLASSEQELQQMAAALKADDTERQSAIANCIEQGVSTNPDPTGMAQFLGLPVEQAWEAWCTRMTNGIANGRLTLADINALSEGTVTPNARDVLTTMSREK